MTDTHTPSETPEVRTVFSKGSRKTFKTEINKHKRLATGGPPGLVMKGLK